MRYMLIPVLVCAFGMTAATALPAARPDLAAASRPDDVLLVAKKSPPPKRTTKQTAKSTRKTLGGIHPLVGSGDY